MPAKAQRHLVGAITAIDQTAVGPSAPSCSYGLDDDGELAIVELRRQAACMVAADRNAMQRQSMDGSFMAALKTAEDLSFCFWVACTTDGGAGLLKLWRNYWS